MIDYNDFEVWFLTGAQLLYGGDAVVAVDGHSNKMVQGHIPLKAHKNKLEDFLEIILYLLGKTGLR